MLHLGDITKINGAKVPVTDCIIFGAPCQDLSVAGKRAGMKHGDLGDEEATRSGLFMEAVRIIKEMRKRDEYNGRTGVDIRPRYGVYENVPGAFSSNKGEDFRIVLEELAKVKDPNAVIPMPEKWTSRGCIMGDGWSIAWRVLDAQFWGVPQRRRRIALVADFGGESAPEILFVRKSVSGNIKPSEQKRKEASADASGSVGADDRDGERSRVYEWHNQDSRIVGPIAVGCTLNTNAGGREGHLVMQCYSKSKRAQSATDNVGDVRTTEAVVAFCIGNGQVHDAMSPSKEVSKTLNCMDDPMKVCIVGTRYIVRRLTPLECERLQGYPDGWTDIGEYIDSNGKKRQSSDAARYKALGNSIALPPWKWVLKRLCACYERDATMASLFDGIGGFPYLWEQLNGKGSCLWASEIEEFPMAVTKVRIGGHT